MENQIFHFCAKLLIFLIVGVVAATCDGGYYMKKDHSLIKPYAGVKASFKDSMLLFVYKSRRNPKANPPNPNLN